MVSAAPAADHVLRILGVVARHPEPMPAAAVAAALGLPRSTAYRLLAVLVEHGYLAYLPEERRYGLGVAELRAGFGVPAAGPADSGWPDRWSVTWSTAPGRTPT